MEYAKIKELCTFLPKSKIKAGEGLEVGKYIFFTSSDTKTLMLNEYLYDEEAIILGTGGKPSCNYFNGKFSVSTDNFVLTSNKIKLKYLYYFLRNNNLKVLENGFHGAGLKHISKDYRSYVLTDAQEKEVAMIKIYNYLKHGVKINLNTLYKLYGWDEKTAREFIRQIAFNLREVSDEYYIYYHPETKSFEYELIDNEDYYDSEYEEWLEKVYDFND